ncbi:glycosyltransferase [Patescibacteria group bacterium]|nr:glycosyltransferase [Patescibacteria group bacterium]
MIKKIIHKLTGVVSLKPMGAARGRVLLSYDTTPFLTYPKQPYYRHHSNQWECAEIARLFLERGFNVDIIKWDNTSFKPKRNYVMIVDIHQNIERLLPFLKPSCIKIMHITATHWIFQNAAEYRQLLALKERRHTVISPQRIVPPAKNIEHADYATILGNEFTRSTYAYAGKILFPIPSSTTTVFDKPTEKDFESCRKNFIWIGGNGFVLKGLDLVLEYFSENSEYHLTVCGKISSEPDFEKLYRRELYEMPNIKTVGKINIASKEFGEIINKSLGLIFPSASEGQSGSVITSMHAGLIPIISRESGVDVENFGIILKNNSKESICETINMLAKESSSQLRERAYAAWEYARKHNTQETFSRAYAQAIDTLITKHKLI